MAEVNTEMEKTDRSEASADGNFTIEAIGISKSFGDRKAVDDLSFKIRSGEVVGLLGPN
ncbi:MAG: hypothetical protein IIC84_09450, partial [Chloroflexi bacterium]|nr:hypothetical protein [Chloroflexota bacterium]